MCKKKTISLLLFLFAGFSAVFSQEQNETLQKTESWPALLLKAKQENKPVFIDCYFTGCHPCALMDKEVFPNELVSKEIAQNFIGVKIDVFKEKLGDSILRKYGLSGFPTFLILNSQGYLVSTFVGYHDAGQLLNELSEAKKNINANKALTGFAPNLNDIYPDFYKKQFDRVERKFDPLAANNWILQQKDLLTETAAMAIFFNRKLDKNPEEFFIKNYTSYKEKFGDVLSLKKASDILADRLKSALNNKKDEIIFRKFLNENITQFPKEDGRILNFLLGYTYYSSIATDTTGLLHFINEDPLVYMNYIGSLHNTLVVKGGLNEFALKQLSAWADKAVNEEAAFDLMQVAASIQKNLNNKEGYMKFVNMAKAKANKYKINADKYEEMLNKF